MVGDGTLVSWSVVGCRWVSGALVGGSVLGGLVEDLSVGRWSVVGSLSVVGRLVIRPYALFVFRNPEILL